MASTITVRVSDADRATLERSALAAGVSLSEYVRRTLGAGVDFGERAETLRDLRGRVEALEQRLRELERLARVD